MKKIWENAARRLLSLRIIAEFPVRVRSGVAQGARWTFFPYSAYWRGTHEPEAQRERAGALAYLEAVQAECR